MVSVRPIILCPVKLREGEDLLIVTAEDRDGRSYRIEVPLHDIFSLLYPNDEGEEVK
jgi:hypothetical protein